MLHGQISDLTQNRTRRVSEAVDGAQEMGYA